MYCNQCGTQFEGKFCPNCGTPATVEATVENAAPTMADFPVVNAVPATPVAEMKKKPIYKKWWFWVIIVIVAIGIIGGSAGDKETSTDNSTDSSISQSDDKTDNNQTDDKTNNKITVADFSTMNKAEIEKWAATNKVTITFSEDYSDTITSGSVISQNKKANETVKEGTTIKVVISKGKKPSIEFQNALKQAETYSEMMNMSKKAIFNQLTSEYGGRFDKDAAQYAIDNLDADYKKNALESAKTYQNMMSMSKSAIYDQLVSEYGGQFTAEEAQYAIDHLDD